MKRLHPILNPSNMSFKYSPPINREMKQLDRAFFIRKVPLVVINFLNPRNISIFSQKFKSEVLRVPRIPHVIKLDDGITSDGPPLKKKTICNDNHILKGILLRDDITHVDELEKKLSKEAQEFLKQEGATVRNYEYTLDYDFWKSDEILSSILPSEYLNEIPSGFTVTGHIAHLNLRNEFKPYGELIGQVILDKNAQIETVVDKIDSINTKFRTFQMKILAGKQDLMVCQKESNCVFSFDFSKVYWNSRLHTEHDRLVKKFHSGECVGDVFAGVGPFAIPAAKKHVIVLANDLNPESFKFMKQNISNNKVKNFIYPTNYDGRKFINESPLLLNNWIKENAGNPIIIPTGKKVKDKTNNKTIYTDSKSISMPRFFNHYVMNLPDSALTFLDEFVGLYSRHHGIRELMESYIDFKLPWIHCHCFEKYDLDENPEPSLNELHKRIYSNILKIMKTTPDILPMKDFQFHLVRKVAPTKPMFCVSFQLPRQLAFATQ